MSHLHLEYENQEAELIYLEQELQVIEQQSTLKYMLLETNKTKGYKYGECTNE